LEKSAVDSGKPPLALKLFVLCGYDAACFFSSSWPDAVFEAAASYSSEFRLYTFIHDS